MKNLILLFLLVSLFAGCFGGGDDSAVKSDNPQVKLDNSPNEQITCQGKKGSSNVEFDSTSMVLTFRVIDGSVASGFENNGNQENLYGSVNNFNKKILIPAINWKYDSASERIKYQKSNGVVGEYGGDENYMYSILFKKGGVFSSRNKLNIAISWGDGTCSKLDADTYVLDTDLGYDNSLLHDYSEVFDSLPEDDFGFKYITVKIKGTMGVLNNSLIVSSNNFLFNYTLSEVVSLGDLDWFSFSSAFSQTSLDYFHVGNANTSNVRDLDYMFSYHCIYGWKITGCTQTNFDLKDLDFSNVISTWGMYQDSIFNTVDLSNQSFDNLIFADVMFDSAIALDLIDFSNVHVPMLDYFGTMFSNLNFSFLLVPYLDDFKSEINNFLASANNLKITGLNFGDSNGTKDYCYDNKYARKISEITDSADCLNNDYSWNERLYNFTNMFENASLSQIDVSDWVNFNYDLSDPSKEVNILAGMFDFINIYNPDNTPFKILGLNTWVVSNPSVGGMFSGVNLTVDVDLSSWEFNDSITLENFDLSPESTGTIILPTP